MSDSLILYLVNILQPVGLERLLVEVEKYTQPSGKSAAEGPLDLEAIIRRLTAGRLILRTKGRYSVTLKGLESISLLGLGRLRDKNRLFNLKKTF